MPAQFRFRHCRLGHAHLLETADGRRLTQIKVERNRAGREFRCDASTRPESVLRGLSRMKISFPSIHVNWRNSLQLWLFICVHLRLSAVFCAVLLRLAQRGNQLALWTQVSHDGANRSMSLSLKAISADLLTTVLVTNAVYSFQV